MDGKHIDEQKPEISIKPISKFAYPMAVRKRKFFPLCCGVNELVNEFLVRLKEAELLVFGYADDVAIMVRGNFLTTFKERMSAAHKNHSGLVIDVYTN